MKKNIAILLGVWDYEFEKKLPPCQKDVMLVSEVARVSKKFDDILLLDHDTKSSTSKEKLTAFVRNYQGQEIGEILFYYTGHGTRKGDDFLFLFSDFDKEKLETTSLRNSELDTMLKSLRPDLTVKIVDACQAGTEYIKAEGDLKTIFEKSIDSFKNLYFFFSSSNNESSIALSDLSVFTKSFLRSLIPFENKEIRYRDIMASISDDPSVKRYQTPLFIQQATNTEVLFKVTPEIVKTLAGLVRTDNVDEDAKLNSIVGEAVQDEVVVNDSEAEEDQLISSIKAKGVDFCTESEAQESLSHFVEVVEGYSWSKIINSLFKVEIIKPDFYSGITGMADIAKWIKGNTEPYFVEIEYSDVEYETREKVEYEDVGGFRFSSFLAREKRVEYRPVTKYKKAMNSISLTAKSPVSSLILQLKPTEQILPWVKIFIVVVFSKSKLTVFSKFEYETERNWNKRDTQSSHEWSVTHSLLKNKDHISSMVKEILSETGQEISREIISKFTSE